MMGYLVPEVGHTKARTGHDTKDANSSLDHSFRNGDCSWPLELVFTVIVVVVIVCDCIYLCSVLFAFCILVGDRCFSTITT